MPVSPRLSLVDDMTARLANPAWAHLGSITVDAMPSLTDTEVVRLTFEDGSTRFYERTIPPGVILETEQP